VPDQALEKDSQERVQNLEKESGRSKDGGGKKNSALSRLRP
jgi:hypothetical protein